MVAKVLVRIFEKGISRRWVFLLAIGLRMALVIGLLGFMPTFVELTDIGTWQGYAGLAFIFAASFSLYRLLFYIEEFTLNGPVAFHAAVYEDINRQRIIQAL